MKWFQLQNNFLDDQKVQRLPKKLFKAYINTLCIASANNPRGSLPSIEKYSFRMRMNLKNAQNTLESLVHYSLIYKKNSQYFINNWNEHEIGFDDRRLPPDVWAKIRLEVFSRDSHTCQYCGATEVNLECDHVVPICKDGSNDMDNLVTACKPCNRSKGGKLLEEWQL